jgi:flagellar biosynthesis anti-sigma factor FlgM
MKINPQIENYIANKPKVNENQSSQQTENKQISSSEDKVTLSQEGILKSKSIDNNQKIEQLKEEIKNGTYSIDSQKISNAILEMDKLF